MGKKIMIAEDDIFVMDIYKTKLSQEGFDVALAENGNEAIKILEEEKALPALILLDILMPYMDGLEFLEKISKDERFKSIPVIMLSNLSQKDDIKKAMDLGAKDYLIKSHFTPSEVMEKVNKYIS